MENTQEGFVVAPIETIDVQQFKEDPTLGDDMPVAIQLKGFNRFDRLKSTKNQYGTGLLGSPSSRPISEGAVLFIKNLSGCRTLSAENFDYTMSLPDTRGIAKYGNDIYVGSVDTVRHINTQTGEKDTIQNPWFAFVHSVQLTRDGKRMLVTSPGFDRIMEIDTQSGKPLWEWSAWEHGYTKTVRSHKTIVTDKNVATGRADELVITNPSDYPGGLGLPAGDRTAFPNSATYGNDESILATLFYGGLIKIDKKTGNVEPVLENLLHPHGIRKYGSGYMVTDTGHGALILMDKDFHPVKRVLFNTLPRPPAEGGEGEWLQQVVPFGDNLLMAIDSNRAVLSIIDLENRRIRSIPYDANWVMQEICRVTIEDINSMTGPGIL